MKSSHPHLKLRKKAVGAVEVPEKNRHPYQHLDQILVRGPVLKLVVLQKQALEEGRQGQKPLAANYPDHILTFLRPGHHLQMPQVANY